MRRQTGLRKPAGRRRKNIARGFAAWGAAFDSLADWASIQDETCAIVKANKACAAVLGMATEELVGKRWDEIIPETEGPWPLSLHRKVLEAGKPVEEDIWDSRLGRHFQVSVSPLKSRNEFSGTLLLAKDISEQKRKEAELQRSHKKFMAIFNQSPIAIEIYGPAGELIAWNRACLEMFGVVDEEEIRGFHLFQDPNLTPEVKAELRKGNSVRFEIDFNFERVRELKLYRTTRSGRRKLDCLSTPLLEENRIIGYLHQIHDITDRRKAEEDLAGSREQLNFAIEGSNLGLWDWTIPTGETTFNGRWAEIVGYTLAELAPLNIATWTKLCHPDDLKASDALLREHFSGAKPYYECEARMRHKDGRWVWVLDRGKVTSWDEKGNPVRMIGIHVDITERKRAEEALFQSNQAARRLVKEAAVVAEIGRIISSSLNIDEVYQLFADKVKSLLPYDRIVISLINRRDGLVINRYVRGEPTPGRNEGDTFPIAGSLTEDVIQNRKGIFFSCAAGDDLMEKYLGLPEIAAGYRSFISVPLLSRNEPIGVLHFRSKKERAYSQEDLKIGELIADQIAGAIANGVLFSELKKAEEALGESEKRYRLLAENASDVIWTMDTNLHSTYVSPSICQLRGYSVEEVLTHKLEDLLTPLSLRVAAEAFSLELTLEKSKPNDPSRSRTLVLEMKRKDGSTVWTESRVAPVHDPEGRLVEFIGVTRDITERRKREEENIRLGKIQTMLTMAATVCHEMHQPMQVIYGYVGFLLANHAEDRSLADTLTLIKKETERMHEITSRLRTIGEYKTKDYLGFGKIFDIHQDPDGEPE